MFFSASSSRASALERQPCFGIEKRDDAEDEDDDDDDDGDDEDDGDDDDADDELWSTRLVLL